MGGALGNRIRSTGYDPESPTLETVTRAKKECKHERSIAKTLYLSSGYGAGPKKIWRTLQTQGVYLKLFDVKRMHEAYWKTYEDIGVYKEELTRQYEDNNGWLLNGFGRPLGVDSKAAKDLVNRIGQSTGHDCQVLYTVLLERHLERAGIPFNWIIADWHDASTVEVDEQYAPVVQRIMEQDVYRELNQLVGGVIQLKGEGKITNNLAESKCE
jgi:hypothetical protein